MDCGRVHASVANPSRGSSTRLRRGLRRQARYCQRAFAALAATLERCAFVMVLRRRFPPIRPPLRPMADMYSEMLAGAALPVILGGSGSGSGIWPVLLCRIKLIE